MDEQNQLLNEQSIVAALKAGAALGNVKTLADGRQVVIVPDGYADTVIEPDYRKPARKAITATLHDAASFSQYVNDFGSEHSRVFADMMKYSFKGILDYHEAAAGPADYCEHIALFQCRYTPEWTTWSGGDGAGRAKNQVEFAEFIENNQPDIVEPAGGIILTIVRTLESHKDARFSSSVRLDNGETQFSYEEDIKATASKGQLEIPERFMLGIAPFQGGPAYRLEARLRYRINDGKLKLWYELLRSAKVLESAFQDTVDAIAKATNVKILQGNA